MNHQRPRQARVFGGVQLRATGADVPLVILKDAWEPAYADRVGRRRGMHWRNRLHFLRIRWRFVRRGDLSLNAFLGIFSVFRKSGVLDAAVRAGLIDRVRFTDLDREQEEFLAYLAQARNNHRPAPYEGNVLQFVTSESPQGRLFDQTMGWKDIVRGRLTTVALPELTVARSGSLGLDAAALAVDRMLATCRAGSAAALSEPMVDGD